MGTHRDAAGDQPGSLREPALATDTASGTDPASRTDGTSSGGRPRWRTWLRNGLVIAAAGSGPLVPFLIFNERAANAPDDLCALIPKTRLERLVPSPKVERSKTGVAPHQSECDVVTDGERATSTARGVLSVDLERHGGSFSSTPAEEAYEDYAFSKRHDLDQDEPVLDIPRLGDDAYAIIKRSEFDKNERQVSLTVLTGSDRIDLRYTATPSNDGLALAAAVTAARSIVEGLSR